MGLRGSGGPGGSIPLHFRHTSGSAAIGADVLAMETISADYAAKLRARLSVAMAAAEAESAPASLLDALKSAAFFLDASPPDARPTWSALDLFRRWRLGVAPGATAEDPLSVPDVLRREP